MKNLLICLLAITGLTMMGCSEAQFSSNPGSTLSSKNDTNGTTSDDEVLVDEDPTDVDDVDPGGDFSCGNGKKVLVCHIPPGNPAAKHEICISRNALPAHLGQRNSRHTDYLGSCDLVQPPVDEDPLPPPPVEEDPQDPPTEDPAPPVEDPVPPPPVEDL